jgi:pimeloyl-ACP methyl ester carboxylesterase
MAGPLDTLAQRFDVIVPDHPAFGGSEALAWIDDISDLAYCYLDAIEGLGLSGVHIVGQSLGGWIALEMAVRSTQCRQEGARHATTTLAFNLPARVSE